MTPTQVKRPWRASVRTVFQALVAFAAVWAVIVEAAGFDPGLPWVATSLVVTGAVTRIMALPAVEDFLGRFLPWLAADPPEQGVPLDRGHATLVLVAGGLVAGVGAAFLYAVVLVL